MNDFFCKVLKREITSRGSSLKSIARACNISESVLHGWLNGVKPSAKNLPGLIALSEYLDIPLSVLLFNKRDSSRDGVVIFSSIFKEGSATYRVLIEKVNTKK